MCVFQIFPPQRFRLEVDLSILNDLIKKKMYPAFDYLLIPDILKLYKIPDLLKMYRYMYMYYIY